MTVNADISDLFFNRDLSAAKRTDARGNFIGYDPDELALEANDFLESIKRLLPYGGQHHAPSLDELLEDFRSRQ